MDALQLAISQLSVNFTQRMEAFESQLQKGSTATHTTATLAADFSVFKNFICEALRALQDQLHLVTRTTDHLEMRSRRKILLFHGVTEENHEEVGSLVTSMVVNKLKFAGFQTTDIQRCHRLGKLSSSSGGKPRPILLKLRDTAMRNNIWYAKTNLKGTGITISEFLTKARHDLFMQARKQLGVSKCWTRDGTVYALAADGAKIRLDSSEDLVSVVAQAATQQQMLTQKTNKDLATTAKPRRMATRK